MSVLYLIIAILLFGLLVAIHEFGHFTVAKLSGIRVEEFAIGMGPAIFSKTKGETKYSLRCIPFGGYCAMTGEDGQSDDPRAFTNAAVWKRLLVLVAGSFMNLLLGFVIMFCLYADAEAFIAPKIASFMEGCPYEVKAAEEGTGAAAEDDAGAAAEKNVGAVTGENVDAAVKEGTGAGAEGDADAEGDAGTTAGENTGAAAEKNAGAGAEGDAGTTAGEKTDAAAGENTGAAAGEGLMVGDRFLSIDGHPIFISSDLTDFLDDGTEHDIVLRRDGKRIVLRNYHIERVEYDGYENKMYGFTLGYDEGTVWNKLKYAGNMCCEFVRWVFDGLKQLLSGGASMKDLSGPVGIVGLMVDTGESAETTSDGLYDIFYIGAFIAVDLAAMNMLPIPALDGGRVFFLLVTWVIERITRKKLDPKYEGYIHAAGMILLLALMAFVMLNDVFKLVTQ